MPDITPVRVNGMCQRNFNLQKGVHNPLWTIRKELRTPVVHPLAIYINAMPPTDIKRHIFWPLLGLGLLLIIAWGLAIGPFPAAGNLHLDVPIDALQGWVIANRLTHPLFLWFFDPLSNAIDFGLRSTEDFLLWLPWPVLMLAIFLLGQRGGGLRLALLATISLLFMGLLGLWTASLQTLALMSISVFICLIIGIPLGIFAARYPRLDTTLRPILDAMQTMPAFVYLIPVLLFFGIARVPSVVATVIYALPPAIRLTTLGIRHVPLAPIEAARSFGATRQQILWGIQLPLALPSIMAGVNQTIMMALGIVVIAAIIGAGGLGKEVLNALQRLKVGQGLEAGLAIVALAIILDRISYAFSRFDRRNIVQVGFRLLPRHLETFPPAQWLERGIDYLYRLGQWLTQSVTKSCLILVKALHAPTADDLAPILQERGFWLISLIILTITLFINKYILQISQFPATWTISIRQPTDTAVVWMRDNLYQIGDWPIGTGPLSDFVTLYALNPLRDVLMTVPWPFLVMLTAWLAFLAAGKRLAVLSGLGIITLGLLGMWEQSMNTLSQVIVSVIFSLIIALPIGIMAAHNDTFEILIRLVLDFLQTIPIFVYLVPVIMLFNIGRVPGVIASIVYALPPAIRLTNLGLRQVDPGLIEAALAYGSTPAQTLWKVKFPLALPSIMLGINQTVMMVLATVITAGLVGGGGLGLEAINGLTRNQTGRGFEAGLAIVILAMIMDRLTQALAKS